MLFYTQKRVQTFQSHCLSTQQLKKLWLCYFSSSAATAATAHSPKTQVECIISKWKKSSKRPFFLLCLSRSASMHVQLLVKVNYNMMITTTSIVGTYHHHINLKWNSLGHNQMRKRGHTIKKKGSHFFNSFLSSLKYSVAIIVCTTFLEDFFFIPYTMPIIMHCYFIN